MSCDHCIGLLYNYDEAYLTTLPELKEHIKAFEETNRLYAFIPCFDGRRVYTLKEYADFRRSTGLTRFRYCPYCGEKINWKEIARG